ncbi:MAG: hypothetical protein HGA16_01355 [Candidatus Moranbacteria bacterium]|nr:hypothetical protein [Candidatus Moranbacteria bacterium]
MRFDIKKLSQLSFQDMLPPLTRYSKWIFVLLFLVAFGSGMLIWYRNIYQGDWSDEVKRQYMDSTFRETSFRDESFRGAIDSISRRAESYQTDVRVKNDIFAPFPGLVGSSSTGGR